MSSSPVQFLSPATQVVKPICPYFGVCGGCDCQDVSYSHQLEAKHRWLAQLFESVAPGEIKPILHSHREYPVFFRNKIRFSFIREDGTVYPSRHKKGEEAAEIAAEQCFLQSEEANQIIREVATFADCNSWSLYDPKTGVGWLKHILIRQGKRTGDCMLCLVTDDNPIPHEAEFIEIVSRRLPFVSSLYHTTSWGKSLENLEDRLLAGKEAIQEKVGHCTFSISPQAFFQTNSEMIETLYDATAEAAGTGRAVWDLYAGSATIGCYMAGNFEKVVSIESNRANCRDAATNFSLNGVTNARIIEGLVEEVLTSAFITAEGAPDCIVVDPPRAGLHQRIRNLLPYCGAQRIVYVSCNPLTALRDIREMTRLGMRLKTLQPIDMFPHSWHVELVAVLEPA